jgi:alanine dehydrogenase
MKTIGFPITTMHEETRVALLPTDLERIVDRSRLRFQKGYARHLEIADSSYERLGATIVPREALSESEVLIIPKRTELDRDIFSIEQTILGWLYIEYDKWLEESIRQNRMTAINFEKLYHADGSYAFKENSVIAGEIGLLHALNTGGKSPSEFRAIAILGNGNLACGALKVLEGYSLKPEVFDIPSVDTFFNNIGKYDVIINCASWRHGTPETLNADHIAAMRHGCYIVDISSEGVHGSEHQSVRAPTYVYIDRPNHSVLIYNNEHIPALVPMRASKVISQAIVPYVNSLLLDEPNASLEAAIEYRKGEKVDR